jgi:hypothetical protein
MEWSQPRATRKSPPRAYFGAHGTNLQVTSKYEWLIMFTSKPWNSTKSMHCVLVIWHKQYINHTENLLNSLVLCSFLQSVINKDKSSACTSRINFCFFSTALLAKCYLSLINPVPAKEGQSWHQCTHVLDVFFVYVKIMLKNTYSQMLSFESFWISWGLHKLIFSVKFSWF